MESSSCEYVASKEEPESWQGTHSVGFGLDRDRAQGGLGISTWHCPHPPLGRDDADEQYCVFHTDPEKVPDDVDERDALLRALNDAGNSPRDARPEHRGQFVGATFGAIDLSGEAIAATKDHDIRFDHARFRAEDDELRFENTTFATHGQHPVSFYRATFTTEGDGHVGFRRATFTTEGDGDFAATTFFGNISFEDADFDATARFTDSWIETTTTLSFAEATFHERAIFGATDGVPYICGHLDFSETTFHDDVNFRGDRTFTGEVTVDAHPTNRDDQTTTPPTSEDQCRTFGLLFADSVDFSGATFADAVDFSATRFAKATTFERARLSGTNFVGADLSGASFERAQLNRAELLGTTLVGAKLYGALLGDARINRNTKVWPETISRWRLIGVGNAPTGGGVLRRLRAGWRGGRVPYCCYDPRYWDPTGEIPDQRVDAEVNLEKAAEVYGTLETVASDNSLPRLVSVSGAAVSSAGVCSSLLAAVSASRSSSDASVSELVLMGWFGWSSCEGWTSGREPHCISSERDRRRRPSSQSGLRKYSGAGTPAPRWMGRQHS